MSTEKYLKQLEKHLAFLEKNKRQDIIKELQTCIEDENLSYDDVLVKFGDVKSLADSYLEDIPIEERKIKIPWYKRMRTYVFLFLLVIIVPLIYTKTKDPFDYSLFNNKTIKTKINQNWHSLKLSDSLNITQAKVTIYFSKNSNIEYTCKKDKKLVSDSNNISIMQKDCIIIVSDTLKSIKGNQSSIVIIKPKQNLFIDLQQASLKIAEKGSFNKYTFDNTKSNADDLISRESNYIISLKLYQAEALYYKY